MTGRRSVPNSLTGPGGKITAYLLNPDHPRGGSKAKFFLGLGFTAARVGEFADAIFAHASPPTPRSRSSTRARSRRWGASGRSGRRAAGGPASAASGS
ncbi:DUF6883 domain-containing protein [Methylobacterium oxalidis]|uniref:DUF6883 domain-containing protein n=1 Tax=Methylobacterium oxalidis TaxID=944322 RepID=UPI003315C1B7